MIELNCSGGVTLCCHLLEHLLTVVQSNPQLLVLLQHNSSLLLQGLLLLRLQHTGSQTGKSGGIEDITQEVRWHTGSQTGSQVAQRKSDRKLGGIQEIRLEVSWCTGRKGAERKSESDKQEVTKEVRWQTGSERAERK